MQAKKIENIKLGIDRERKKRKIDRKIRRQEKMKESKKKREIARVLKRKREGKERGEMKKRDMVSERERII